MYIDPPKAGRAMFRTGFGYGATMPSHDADALRVQRAMQSDYQRNLDDEALAKAERRETVMTAVFFICCLAAIPAGIYADRIGHFLGLM